MSPRRPREATEFAAFCRRIFRAYGRRELDPADLADLVELRRELDAAISSAVVTMRANGYSWSEIGSGLGTTKQSAQERFGGR